MKRIADEIRQRIIDMRREGRSYDEIRQATGLSRETVYRVMRDAGLVKSIVRAPVTPQIEAQILDLNAAGVARSRICEHLQISPPTVRKVLARAGFGSRPLRKRTSRVSEETKELVVKKHNAGISSRIIARDLGLAKRTVIVILNERVYDLRSNTRSNVSPMEFVAAWQESDTAREVCEKTGLSYSSVHQRAFEYRLKGVPLKRYNRGNAIDWDDLKEFALLYEDEG